MDRRIAPLDMDAFYASVELQRYPQLRGLPLVVGVYDDPADLLNHLDEVGVRTTD